MPIKEYEVARKFYSEDETNNIEEAIRLYRIAANLKSPEAYYDLACIYIDNPQLTNSVEYAYSFMYEAAMLGDFDAMYEFALMNSDNKFNHKNNKKCIYWLIMSNKDDVKVIKLLQEKIIIVERIIDKKTPNDRLSWILDLKKWIKKNMSLKVSNLIRKSINKILERTIDDLLVEANTCDKMKKIYDVLRTNNKFSIEKGYYDLYFSQLGNIKLRNSNSIDDYQMIFDTYGKISDSNPVRRKNIEKLYYWMAQSYQFGKNNAEIDCDKAIQYYRMITKNESYVKEMHNYVIEYIRKLIKNDDYLGANKYLDCLPNSIEYSPIINDVKNKVKYEEMLNKAKTNDLEAKLYVSKALYNGIGVNKNIELSVKSYEKILRDDNSSDALSFLLVHYYRNNDTKKLKELINCSYEKRIEIEDYEAKKIFELYNTKKYATNDYNVIKIDEIDNIDVNENNIYYITEHFSKKICDANPHMKSYLDKHRINIAVKNGYYNRDYIYGVNRQFIINFPSKIALFFSKLKGNWNICYVPGHDPLKNTHGSIPQIVQDAHLPYDKVNAYDIIRRKYYVEPKHNSSNRNIQYFNDMQSLYLAFSPKGRNWVIIDDITTSGSTMIACRNLLLDNGADHVVCLALAKTRGGW